MIHIKKHLFLTGPSGCGKSHMLREVLGFNLSMAGGFVTERVCDAQGKLLGFDLLPAAAAGGVQGFQPQRILDYSVNPPRHFNEVFRNEGARLLQEAEYYPFSLIDEFGGFEMVIPQFRSALEDFLNYEQPIIGVLKAPKNAEELRERFGLGEKYSMYLEILRQALLNDPDTLLLETTGRDDMKARRIVEQWAKEYAGG